MKKQAFNPYLPSWEYIPDGEPYVFDGRVYVYGSHDFYNGYVFCMGDYVCWSAPVDDLGNWRYEGVIYPKLSGKSIDDIRNSSLVKSAMQLRRGQENRVNKLNGYLEEIGRSCEFKHWYFGSLHEDRIITPHHTCVFKKMIAIPKGDKNTENDDNT